MTSTFRFQKIIEPPYSASEIQYTLTTQAATKGPCEHFVMQEVNVPVLVPRGICRVNNGPELGVLCVG